jgi:exopolysaccharide biosynthesis protein
VASDNRFAIEEFWISRMAEDAYVFGIVPTEYPTDVGDTRAARIGIGADVNGDIVIVAMSGSSKGIARPGIDSVGATLLELADQLHREGAVDAINLDGGGSTQVFVEGGLYNSPGDRRGRQGVTYERMVPTIGVVR